MLPIFFPLPVCLSLLSIVNFRIVYYSINPNFNVWIRLYVDILQFSCWSGKFFEAGCTSQFSLYSKQKTSNRNFKLNKDFLKEAREIRVPWNQAVWEHPSRRIWEAKCTIFWENLFLHIKNIKDVRHCHIIPKTLNNSHFTFLGKWVSKRRESSILCK